MARRAEQGSALGVTAFGGTELAVSSVSVPSGTEQAVPWGTDQGSTMGAEQASAIEVSAMGTKDASAIAMCCEVGQTAGE